MGKSSARKARERKLAMDYASTPVTDKASSKSAARADDFSMPRQPLISDAAKGGAMNQPPSAAFEEGLAEPTREELIAALPELRAVTGNAGEVDNFKDILIWPLRSTSAKVAAFDEVTPAEKIDVCTEKAWGLIKAAIESDKAGIDVFTAIPRGRRALVANRSRNFKLGFDATYTLSVVEAYDQHVLSCIIGMFGAIIEPDEIESFDYEVAVPRGLITGGVLEQISIHLGVSAAPRFDFAYRTSTVYCFCVTSAAHEARVLKMGGITLGKMGTFPFKPATVRVTMEDMYVLGTTGVGSARADLRPAFAGAVACSTNMIKAGEAQSVKKDFKVIKLTYPYSSARYDAVTKLFKQGRFQLVNPRVEDAKPLEIFVAPTLIELGHIAGVTLVKAASALEGDEGEDEEVKAIDLSQPE